MSLLAVDAGTTGVTAMVVTDDGDVEARATQQLVRQVPHPDWVEHAPEAIWQATLAATRAVLSQVDTTDLRGLGVTNQRATVVLWDRDTLGSPRTAIASQDRRDVAICARLRDGGHEPRVTELTGLGLGPGWSGTTLVWLRENEPHTWALVEAGRYAIGTVDSYLIARMTRGLEHVTDVSNASRTLLLDLAEGDWSDELCSLLGVPRDALPELVPSWGDLAVTEPRTFLDLALPIAGIAADRSAVLFGQACLEVGETSCTYGPGASVLTNTGLALERSDAGLLSTAAWRSPSGELTYALEGTTRATLAPATPEEIGRGVREVLEAVPGWPDAVTSLRVDGGAAADDVLCQTLADRVGVRVERPRLVETAALGAALLAGLGTGVWSSTDDLRDVRRPGRAFTPGAPA